MVNSSGIHVLHHAINSHILNTAENARLVHHSAGSFRAASTCRCRSFSARRSMVAVLRNRRQFLEYIFRTDLLRRASSLRSSNSKLSWSNDALDAVSDILECVNPMAFNDVSMLFLERDFRTSVRNGRRFSSGSREYKKVVA